MNEFSPKPAENQETLPELTDVSQRIHSELETFRQQEAKLAAPRDLYISLPGQEIRVLETIDKGCRGGWTETHTIKMNSEPVKITKVSALQYIGSNGLKLGLWLERYGHTSTTLTDEDLQKARFYELEPREQSDYDQYVKRLLEASSFTTATSDELAPDWHLNLAVRSKFPLTNPVVVALHGWDEKQAALDGRFDRISSYYNQETKQTMAQVTVRTSNRAFVPDTTPWVPLDHLEFYTEDLSLRYALEHALSRCATKLINGETQSTDTINHYLSQVESRAKYPLAYESSRYDMPHTTTQFILGKIAASGPMERMFVPVIDRMPSLGKLHIEADEVQMFYSKPWVVNKEVGLATPLTHPTFDTSPKSYSRPVEQAASDLAAEHTETA